MISISGHATFRPLRFLAADQSSGTSTASHKLTLQEIRSAFAAVQNAGYEGTRERPDLRAEFLRVSRAFGQMPIEEKAALIAEVTKECLAEAQNLIDTETKAKGGPFDSPFPALTIWERLLSHRVEKYDRRSDAAIIGDLFPLLNGKSNEIANAFSSAYVFWANFCACSEYGVIGTTGTQSSLWIDLSPADAAIIDNASGMRSLGNNLRGFANYLYMTND